MVAATLIPPAAPAHATTAPISEVTFGDLCHWFTPPHRRRLTASPTSTRELIHTGLRDLQTCSRPAHLSEIPATSFSLLDAWQHLDATRPFAPGAPPRARV